jgi:hypothetical protein
MATKSKKAGPTITVDPKHCKIHPLGKIHAQRKSKGGYVIFHALAPCTLLFTNPSVFGHQFIKLEKGPHKRSTKVERGRTLVMIAGCEYRIPRSLGAASQPSEIIVP